ncbi:MAG: hypothetical protein JWO82_2862 [Akkermansiaceae bacterium]|nr:hypothetical protein [Akkermansiaceae bacterium]
MNDALLESFLKEDGDESVRALLLHSLVEHRETDRIRHFSFNRFNVLLDFEDQHAVIDDELNPSDGTCRISLETFKKRLEGTP